jgi:hypothetical protein
MGVLSSVRAVRWARKHQPEQVQYYAALAQERFPPDDLPRQAGDPHEALRVYGDAVLPELRG